MNRRGFLGLLAGLPFLPLVNGAKVPDWHFSYALPKDFIKVERLWYYSAPVGKNWVYELSEANDPEDWSVAENAGYIDLNG